MNLGFAFSDSDSDDDGIPVPRNRTVRPRACFNSFSPDQLRECFRFNRRILEAILELIRPQLQRTKIKPDTLHEETILLAAFRYYATGDHLRVVADTVGIDISSTSRAITVVTDALLRHAHRFIKMPSVNEAAEVKYGFYQRAQMPGIIGAVDGTQVRIQRPIGQLDEQFICRKGYASLNMLAVCDHKRRFRYVHVKFPGSAHDSAVLRSSNLFDAGEAGDLNGLLIGDSGYALSNWLLTPIHATTTDSEKAYNTAHVLTRVVIEQAFGILKRRWIVTHSEVRLHPGKVCKMFDVCCMLHNIAIDGALEGYDDLVDDDSDHDSDTNDDDNDHNNAANQARRDILAKRARSDYVRRHF